MYGPDPEEPPDAVAEEPHAPTASAKSTATTGAARGLHLFAEILID
ncbi:MAG TPA: hypothetical protein VKA05_05865 [Acidimicrobiales bacterium]|nr:hypothetical protein [Acidimicrobiales bacterium]